MIEGVAAVCLLKQVTDCDFSTVLVTAVAFTPFLMQISDNIDCPRSLFSSFGESKCASTVKVMDAPR